MSKGKKTVYTDEQMQFVSDNRSMTIAGLHKAFCEKFGRHDVSKWALKSFRLRKGWTTGRTGRMEPGKEAWNKGVSYMPGGDGESRFKKGHQPYNLKPAGSERKGRGGYVEIKVTDRKWALKHRVVWERKNGPVPDGHVLIFRDNDKTNCDIKNMMLVTRGEMVVMSKCGYHHLTGEAKDTGLLMARLKMKQRELLK